MPDLQSYTNLLVIGLLVLLLLVIAVLIYRVLNSRVRGRKGARLGISEFYEIDKSRRLVLVRRDDYEHLILIGGQQDIVVESGIPSGMMNPLMPQMAPQQSPPPLRNAPRPPVFGGTRQQLRAVDPAYGDDDDQR